VIGPCGPGDIAAIEAIINDAAHAYRGAIPPDRWHDPYMSRATLEAEIAAGVEFWGWRDAAGLVGVMGTQDVRDATLIRHAYVRTRQQRSGIGGALMKALIPRARGRLMVGTWAAAHWAIAFYQRHGFRLVSPEEKDRLLDAYWTIPSRQRESSVVLLYEATRGSRAR
jgi:GNAT superfamily N-acetyltransferase